MAPPTLRGTAAVVALTSGAVERTVIEHKAELLIANCAPGLLRSYMRLGLRPYGAQPFQTYSGLQIPVAGVTADVDHLRRCGSPWAPVLRRLKQRGQLSARDFQPLLPPFADRSFDTNCDQVLAALNQVRARSPFLQLLSPKVMALLAQGGTLFRLQPDLDMIVKGYANRDVFLLIDGALEVRANEQRITTIQPGEVIGEIAFFHPSGQRTAAVRSIAPSQLIHIGHSHLRRMAKRHGLATVEVYEALARVAVDRLAASKAATS